jgi:anti-sigma28 factor (negative regulator of flagellin synthesis)
MHTSGLGPVPNIPSSSQTPPPQVVKLQTPTEPDRSEDRVEISPEALAGTQGEAPDVRALRLAQIKAAIEAGDYETPDKLEAALARLFDELGLEDDADT